MTQYAKVIALTALPDFYDMYGTQGPIGGTYNPSVGDEGYMELSAAQTAQTAGDVLIHVENTPLDIDVARGAVPPLSQGMEVAASPESSHPSPPPLPPRNTVSLSEDSIDAPA